MKKEKLDLFSISDAAQFLGVSVPTIKYHVKQGNLTGRHVGHSRIFTRSELEKFQANRKPAHRPVTSTAPHNVKRRKTSPKQ